MQTELLHVPRGFVLVPAPIPSGDIRARGWFRTRAAAERALLALPAWDALDYPTNRGPAGWWAIVHV